MKAGDRVRLKHSTWHHKAGTEFVIHPISGGFAHWVQVIGQDGGYSMFSRDDLEPVSSQDEWIECLRIADLPAVDECIQGFADDRTGDNAVMIVREVMRAVNAAVTLNAQRYVQWRDAMINNDVVFVVAISKALPDDINDRQPTPAEWDTALDKVRNQK